MDEQNLNATQLLLQISTDVAVIKSDMKNFKDNTRKEISDIEKDIGTMRTDFKSDIKVLDGRITALENTEDKKDAGKYRKILGYLGTALAAMLFARVPEILSLVLGGE